MKRFGQVMLTKELVVLFILGVILILYSAFPEYYHSTLQVQAQLQQQQQQPMPIISIKITSPMTGQQVPVGELRITGISTDNASTDCTVYAGWDGQKPFQNTKALGPGGLNDYSTWAFTYTPAYHAITNKTNQLSAQISCLDDNANNNNSTAANLTKSYSVNVIGITESSAMVTSAAEEEQNNGTTASIITSSKSIPSVPTPLPLLPSIQEQEEDKEEDNEEEEPQTEPEPEPEDDDDTTIYWDIEEDVDEDNEEVFDFEDNMFDLE